MGALFDRACRFLERRMPDAVQPEVGNKRYRVRLDI